MILYKYMNKNGIKISEQQAFVDTDTTCQDVFIRSLSLPAFEKRIYFSIPLTEKYLPEVLKLMLCWLQVHFCSHREKTSSLNSSL